MNILKRSITSNLCFSSHPSRKWRFLLYSTTYTLNPPKSPKRSHTPPPPATATAPTPSSSKVEAVKLADVPRPIEIPYQAKVANLVNLIGHIKAPVKFSTSPDSKYWASTVIYQENGRHHSCLIPVVFEGDLAHVVSFHVKENDCVYVTGRLSKDPLPLVLSETPGKLHLRVENVHFVQGYEKQRSSKKFGGNLSSGSDDIVMASKEEYRGGFLGEKGAGESIVFPGGESYRTSKKSVGSKKGEDSGLVQNSREGWDYFEQKSKGLVSNKYPDFEHEDTGPKCIGESIVAPVGENYRTSTRSNKGDDPVFDSHLEQKSQGLLLNKYPGGENHQSSIKSVGSKKGEDSVLDSWRDLVQNSREWRDYREQKSKGLVSNKYPDFKHKDTGAALWLGRSSPEWVLGGLESLEFYVPPPKQKQGQKQGKDVKEYLFKSLAENPSDWWDNRVNKKNPKAPDFKHKTSGEALWLDSLPDWVLSKLPPTGEKQNVFS